MRELTISLLVFLLFIAAASISFCDANSDVLCIESERQALLKLKQDLIDPSNRLSSWVEGGDCCKWTRVFCHNLTGHVNELHLAFLINPDYDITEDELWGYYRPVPGFKINPSLLDLKHLSFLDLSNNQFEGIPIPKFIGSLGSLTYLNLSHTGFHGAIPHELGNLSRLQYLDLRGIGSLEADNLQWVSGLSSLQYLDLSENYWTFGKATDWLQVLKLPFLLELHLSDCFLENDPSVISVNSTNRLAVLDLSQNYQLHPVPTWIFSLHGLVSIDLSSTCSTTFRSTCSVGHIPDYFRNISMLEVLDLSANGLNSFPESLYSLSHLQSLSLRANEFQAEILSFIGNLSSVIHLDLSYNNIDQEVSQILLTLSSLEKLESLNISNNQISGPISFSIGELSSLKLFDVSKNQLNGTFPQSFGRLANLETLSFGHNLLEGNVSEMHFSNLKRLRILKASNNLLRFKPNPSWIPPFHCEIIELGYWHLGSEFPQWLKFQKNLSFLDISNAEISDVIPTWFWNFSTQFQYVNLSHNKLIGEISYLPIRYVADLSSNQFTGPLPRVFPKLEFLSLSNNSFSGSLHQLVCNSSSEVIILTQIFSQEKFQTVGKLG